MPYLIKGANVFTPKFLGKKDVLILEEKIAAIEDDLSQVSLPNLEVIEAKGLNLTPGFMDQHVHITGGGGEGGPETIMSQATRQFHFPSLRQTIGNGKQGE